MLRFSQLAVILEAHRAGKDSMESLVEKLAALFSEASLTEAKALAYLATGRLGAPHAPRIPWTGMTAQRLYNRFRRARVERGEAQDSLVGVLEVYKVLHMMDPIRPDWYPDKPELAEDLISVVKVMGREEFKWVVNLILGRELLSDRLVVNCIVRAAEGSDDVVREVIARMNKCTPDIGLAAELILRDGIDKGVARLGQIHFGVPIPLEIMNTQSKQKIARALGRLGSERVFVQAKSDGVYIQLQKDCDAVYLFDESGADLARLPKLRNSSPKLKRRRIDLQRDRIASRIEDVVEMVRGIPAQRIILDAEIVGISATGDSVVSRAKTFEAKALQLLVFDIIATDRDLRTVLYEERHRMMHQLLGNTPPAFAPGIYAAEEVTATGVNAVTEQFESFTRRNRYEGVILKNPLSHLTPKLRWSSKRVKIKNYTTLDMLLVGFYFNRAKTKPTKYLGALRGIDTDRFYPCVIAVAKRSLEEELNRYCLTTATKVCPPDVVNEGDPDRWTEASLVVEVESDGLIEENFDPKFASVQWTLHRDRQRMIVGIRRDKPRSRANALERLFSLERAPGF